MAKTDLPSVNKRLAEGKKAAEAKEEIEARAKPLKANEVLVRLIRPFLLRSGEMLQPGIHRLPENVVPKSAKRIEGGAND